MDIARHNPAIDGRQLFADVGPYDMTAVFPPLPAVHVSSGDPTLFHTTASSRPDFAPAAGVRAADRGRPQDSAFPRAPRKHARRHHRGPGPQRTRPHGSLDPAAAPATRERAPGTAAPPAPATRSEGGGNRLLVVPTFWALRATSVALALLAVRSACRRVRYEIWYVPHLTAYLVLLLGYGHQFTLGADLQSPLARGYWTVLYTPVIACPAWGRLVGPLVLTLRHRLKVTAVVPEADGIFFRRHPGQTPGQARSDGTERDQPRCLRREFHQRLVQAVTPRSHRHRQGVSHLRTTWDARPHTGMGHPLTRRWTASASELPPSPVGSCPQSTLSAARGAPSPPPHAATPAANNPHDHGHTHADA